MASEPPKIIQTLGRTAGKEYDSGINFEEAMLAFSWDCQVKVSFRTNMLTFIKERQQHKCILKRETQKNIEFEAGTDLLLKIVRTW